jgi:hypothetical protein
MKTYLRSGEKGYLSRSLFGQHVQCTTTLSLYTMVGRQKFSWQQFDPDELDDATFVQIIEQQERVPKYKRRMVEERAKKLQGEAYLTIMHILKRG